MAIQRMYWAEQTDEHAEAAGNFRGSVLGPKGPDYDPIWSGWLAGWQETPSGALSIRRAVELDPDHKVVLEAAVIAKGAWSQVTIDGFIFDLDAVLAHEEEQRQAEAAAKLGLQPANGVGPNRAVRHHPNN
jgi:hypothetical protein